MVEKTYNGWTNYETWLVALWFDNDAGDQEHWLERAYELKDSTNSITGYSNGRYLLAQEMKDSVEEYNPCQDAGFYTDLMEAAIAEVDWLEIAEHYIDDVQ